MDLTANTPRVEFAFLERNRNVEQRFLCFVGSRLDKVKLNCLIFTFSRNLASAALKRCTKAGVQRFSCCLVRIEHADKDRFCRNAALTPKPYTPDRIGKSLRHFGDKFVIA